jgi:DNA-binding NarL/FixJ family response regulator
MALTPRERDIIELLAAGHTDASVPERLGLSTRTIAYTLRGLMDRLEVQSRFQLGLALALQDPGEDEPDQSGTRRKAPSLALVAIDA